MRKQLSDDEQRIRKNKWNLKWIKKSPWLSRLYSARNRCNCKTNKGYKWYGARGIKCLLTRQEAKELWFRDKAYNLKRPSVDRIDNDGNYEFSNCRFIDRGENTRRASRNKKPILQYSLDGKLIKKWDGVMEALRETKISHIVTALKGRQHKAGGYVWKYAN